jgi:hypothetical protein
MAAIVACAVLGWVVQLVLAECLKIAWNEICVTGTRSGGSWAGSQFGFCHNADLPQCLLPRRYWGLSGHDEFYEYSP